MLRAQASVNSSFLPGSTGRSFRNCTVKPAFRKRRAARSRTAPGKTRCASGMPGPATVATLITDVPEPGKLTRREGSALVEIAPVNRGSGGFNSKLLIFGGRATVRRM